MDDVITIRQLAQTKLWCRVGDRRFNPWVYRASCDRCHNEGDVAVTPAGAVVRLRHAAWCGMTTDSPVDTLLAEIMALPEPERENLHLLLGLRLAVAE